LRRTRSLEEDPVIEAVSGKTVEVTEVQGRRFSVVGGARSGIAVAKLLRNHGAEVFLSEKAPAETMSATVGELKEYGVAYEFGGNTEEVLKADVIVVSPGVPSDVPVVADALARSLRVVSEIEVASWFCKAPIVAVTGTNGKTTTTALLGRIFEDAKKAYAVGGNIGVAFSEMVHRVDEHSIAVLEVSSFQLEHIETFKPKISVMLNMTPDHLDRYGNSFEKYIRAKCRVFMNQDNGDSIVYNYDDTVTRRYVNELAPAPVRRLPFSTEASLTEGAWIDRGRLKLSIGGEQSEIIQTEDISIRGKHNLYNAMAASLAAKAKDVSTASIRATLKNFKGVEHRLEFVREVNGVMFFNDSKATNVESVWYALQSFTSPIVLLLGGRDKGNDYSRLIPLVRKHVKTIVAIGESADKVVGSFAEIVRVRKASSMDEALHLAASVAVSGDVVLLSPACASFDWFENYEHRGRVFKERVHKI